MALMQQARFEEISVSSLCNHVGIPRNSFYRYFSTKDADRYTLDGNGNLRSTVMYLNGNPLTLCENDELPALTPIKQAAGTVELAPGSCTFFVL